MGLLLLYAVKPTGGTVRCKVRRVNPQTHEPGARRRPITTRTAKRAQRRIPLTRERVLEAAIKLADQGGLESLSMRKLGQALGVEAMALYYHLANKDEVLDGIVDIVFAEIDLPVIGADWKTAMRQRAISLRDVLSRHRWAIGMMEARRDPGPANLRHHDAVIGNLRAAGFDSAMVAHAYSLLDGYIYGFALTKMNIPFDTPEEVEAVTQRMLEPFPLNEYPNLATFVAEHLMRPGYDFEEEFEYGLDVILDGLGRVRDEA